jgi:glycosyltransferase involved in cell wall biosynthesis
VSPADPSAARIPRITCVTPSFNQGAFLEECIESVLGQRYPNLEYIVMDGGSEDGSVDIVKRYERHLAYWQSGADGGQYRAITEGFRRGTGEVLCWLNSDDKLLPRAFHKAAYVFVHHPFVEWITGRHTSLTAAGEMRGILRRLDAISRKGFMDGSWTRFIQQESTFWRRRLWERAGGTFRSDLEYAADFELWMRFFRLSPLYTVDAVFGGFRRHQDQKSALHREVYLAEVRRVLDRERRECPWGSAPPDHVEAAILRIPPRDLRAYVDEVSRHQGSAPPPAADHDADSIIDYLLADREALLDEHDELRRTLSWRVTTPLRWVSQNVRGWRRRSRT